MLLQIAGFGIKIVLGLNPSSAIYCLIFNLSVCFLICKMGIIFALQGNCENKIRVYVLSQSSDWHLSHGSSSAIQILLILLSGLMSIQNDYRIMVILILFLSDLKSCWPDVCFIPLLYHELLLSFFGIPATAFIQPLSLVPDIRQPSQQFRTGEDDCAEFLCAPQLRTIQFKVTPNPYQPVPCI